MQADHRQQKHRRTMRAAISLAVVICLAMQQPSGGAATAAAPQRQRPSDSEADGGGGGVGTQAFYILFANQIESPDWPEKLCQNGAHPLCGWVWVWLGGMSRVTS